MLITQTLQRAFTRIYIVMQYFYRKMQRASDLRTALLKVPYSFPQHNINVQWKTPDKNIYTFLKKYATDQELTHTAA